MGWSRNLAPQAKNFKVLLSLWIFLRRRRKFLGTEQLRITAPGQNAHPTQISATPPRSEVECGVEYLKGRGGVRWSFSRLRFSTTPPRSEVECGVEFLDRRGGVGGSRRHVSKGSMNTPIVVRVRRPNPTIIDISGFGLIPPVEFHDDSVGASNI